LENEGDLTHEKFSVDGFEDGRSYMTGNADPSSSWERSLADSQQGNRCLSPTTTKNHILPTVSINLEADFSLELPVENSV